MRGALFETWVIGEMLKHGCNRGEVPELHFWRDATGHEVDLLVGRAGRAARARDQVRPDHRGGLARRAGAFCARLRDGTGHADLRRRPDAAAQPCHDLSLARRRRRRPAPAGLAPRRKLAQNASFLDERPRRTDRAGHVARTADEINWDYAVIERQNEEDLQTTTWMKDLKDWTQIFYQFGPGAAAIKVIRD